MTESISHLLYSHLFDGLRPDRVPVSDDHISHALGGGESTVYQEIFEGSDFHGFHLKSFKGVGCSVHVSAITIKYC